jgi:hypothetical protein
MWVGLVRLVGHVLVEEQALIAVDAVANEGDEVYRGARVTDDPHLGAELTVAMPAPGAESHLHA